LKKASLFQSESTKRQHPSSKEAPNFNTQTVYREILLRLVIEVSLDVGPWNLEL